MRFLIDNSLSPWMVAQLVSAGHDALHVRDVGLAAADDATIFAAAAEGDRVLLAQDTDFAAILSLRQEVKPSVLLFRCRTRTPSGLLTLLTANLPTIAHALDCGAIVVFDDSRIRVRLVPVGSD